jgi:hypothetical protein
VLYVLGPELKNSVQEFPKKIYISFSKNIIEHHILKRKGEKVSVGISASQGMDTLKYIICWLLINLEKHNKLFKSESPVYCVQCHVVC